MVAIIGLFGSEYALMHLFVHAAFKALLFLAAGALIHAISNDQSIRAVGGLEQNLFLSLAIYLRASGALLAVPFLAGFFSKDALLELMLIQGTPLSQVAYLLGICAALFTTYYSVRLGYSLLLSALHLTRVAAAVVHDVGNTLYMSVIGLDVLTIIIGYYISEFFFSSFYALCLIILIRALLLCFWLFYVSFSLL